MNVKAITYSLGAAIGAATAVGVYLARRDRDHAARLEQDTIASESRVRARLMNDGLAERGTLRVSALTPGIVELSGTVEVDDDAHRAVGLAQEVEGVHTVVNRIEVTDERSRLARNRSRYDAGDPELTESHWYGQRVGTGRRRQSAGTDPDRPSDKVPMVSKDLGAAAAEDHASEPLAKVAPSVEDHTTTPAAPTHAGSVKGGEERTVAEPREGTVGAMNASPSTGEPAKPGVERSIEEAGLRRQRPEQGREPGEEGR